MPSANRFLASDVPQSGEANDDRTVLDDLTVLQTSGNQDMGAVAQTTVGEAMALGDDIDPNQFATIHQGGGRSVDHPANAATGTAAGFTPAAPAFARRDTRVEAVDDQTIEDAARQVSDKPSDGEDTAIGPATAATSTIDDVILAMGTPDGTTYRAEETKTPTERESVENFAVEAATNEAVSATSTEVELEAVVEPDETDASLEDATAAVGEGVLSSDEPAIDEESPASEASDDTEFESDEDATETEVIEAVADDSNNEANPEPGVRLNGSRGDDVLNGGNGNDRLKGRRGDDELNGHGGNDVLKGGHGDDAVNGGDGNDRLDGNHGDDRLDGGAGNDRLRGGHGDDELFGGDGDDRLIGGRGDDVMYGGADDDRLVGGRGDDIMHGGAGDDVMRGGRGDDLFVYSGDDREDGAWHDRVDGGRGDDTLDLSGAGEGWSVHLDDGSIFEPAASNDGVLEEPHGFSGVVEFDEGGQIEFNNIETLSW